MNRRPVSLLLLLGLLGSLGNAWGQQDRWRELPPEERQQMRQQMRDHWQQEHRSNTELEAPPQAPARWRDIPPEDRQRMREEMRSRDSWVNFRSAGPGGLGGAPAGFGGPGGHGGGGRSRH